MSYCSLDDVKVFSRVLYDQLGMLTADYDAWISGTLIPKAKDIIDSYVGHNFEVNVGTIRLDGSGRETLHINRRGLVSPTVTAGATYHRFQPPHLLPIPLVTVDYVSIDSGANIVTSCQTYDAFLTYNNNCFSCGRQNVEIRGTWGYGTYPQDIRNVAMSICTNVIRGQLKRWLAPDIITKAVMSKGGLTSYYAEDLELTPDLKLILDRYRFPEIG